MQGVWGRRVTDYIGGGLSRAIPYWEEINITPLRNISPPLGFGPVPGRAMQPTKRRK